MILKDASREISTDLLIEILQSTNEPISFSFIKKDGTERKVLGTHNFNLIPVEAYPKDSSTNNESSNVKFYDLEAAGWRSLSADTKTVKLLK